MPTTQTHSIVQRAGRKALGLATAAAAGLFGILRRNPKVRNVAYNLRNRRQFTDLYMHEVMLADRPRVDAYYEGIARHVGPGDVVVELGTGSGILSCFAAQQGPAVVHAIDHSEVIDVARQVAAANSLDITFHQTHSRNVSLERPATVLIQEQIGDWVFNENMIANVTELRDRLLAPGGMILPALFDVYVEPVQTTDDAQVPFIWEQNLHGVDFSSLRPRSDQARQESFAYRSEPLMAENYKCLLSDPEPAMTVDLMTVQPRSVPRSLSVRRTITRAGRMDGFCLYFVAHFDETTSFTNSPEAPRTHWQIPLLRTPARRVEVGDEVSIRLTMPEIAVPSTWRWQES